MHITSGAATSCGPLYKMRPTNERIEELCAFSCLLVVANTGGQYSIVSILINYSCRYDRIHWDMII